MKHPNTQSQGDPPTQTDSNDHKIISVYRVSLIKEKSVSFEQAALSDSRQAHSIVQSLILTRGQPDREQFVVAMLNSKNDLIGLNIVSVGALSATTVHPREVLKPAILANSAAIILCHNHPSNDLQPSADDIAITKTIIRAAAVIGIQVHEHLIISLENDQYFSFADQVLIKQVYSEIS